MDRGCIDLSDVNPSLSSEAARQVVLAISDKHKYSLLLSICAHLNYSDAISLSLGGGMDNTSISSGAMDAGFGPLRLLSVIVIITIFAAVFIFKPLLSNRALEEFYESQPCPSRKQQRFSWLRATLRSFTDTSDCVEEGYTKVIFSGYRMWMVDSIAKIETQVLQVQHSVPRTQHPQRTNPRSSTLTTESGFWEPRAQTCSSCAPI